MAAEPAESRSYVDQAKKLAYEGLIAASNAVHSVSTVDQFDEKGFITPEQFVEAGDMLTSKCRTWTWESGDPSKAFPYLPPDKQFLLTRRVPCQQRAREVEQFDGGEEVIEGDEADGGWALTITAGGKKCEAEEEIPDIDSPVAEEAAADEDDEESIPDIDDFDEENLVVETDPALKLEDTLMRTRTYDLYITYDQFHQTPKVYLQGFDEDGQPLTPEQTFEDIASDYVHKTVSIEEHPHLPLPAVAYIHPCRHAQVMQRLTSMMKESGGAAIRADQSLFLFLKFISSVVPTIRYDFTSSVDVGAS